MMTAMKDCLAQIAVVRNVMGQEQASGGSGSAAVGATLKGYLQGALDEFEMARTFGVAVSSAYEELQL